MKRSVMLTIASLLSILFLIFHLTGDFARGLEPVRPWVLIALPVVGGWLYAALVIGEKRAGYFVNLLGGIFALLMPVLHMSREWPATSIAKPGTFFFIFTLLTLGVLGVFCILFSLRGLINPLWGQSKL